MKIIIEKNPSKIRNLKALEEAEFIFENDSKQGFFKSKGESKFQKFRAESKIEDAKLIELHIVKIYGKGEYKLNGNLSYNDSTKEIKFYVLSAFEFNDFKFNEKQYVEVINETNGPEEDFAELQAAIKKMKDTKPKNSYRRPVPGSANERYQQRNKSGGNRSDRDGNRSNKSGGNNWSRNNKSGESGNDKNKSNRENDKNRNNKNGGNSWSRNDKNGGNNNNKNKNNENKNKKSGGNNSERNKNNKPNNRKHPHYTF